MIKTKITKEYIGIVAPVDIENKYPIGGTLTYLINFIELSDRPIIVFGATLAKSNLKKIRKIKINEKRVIIFPIIFLKKKRFLPIRILSIIYVFINLNRIYKYKSKIRNFYIHSPETALPFSIFKKNRIIFHMHGATNPLLFSRYKFFRFKIFIYLYNNIIYNTIFKNVDLIIGINKECFDLIKTISPRSKIFILPNLINVNRFKKINKIECRQIINLPLRKSILLYVGRLSYVKGLVFLIEITKALVEDYGLDIFLVLVGDGEERKKLEHLVSEYNLSNKIFFMGNVNYDFLPYIYNAADIFLLTSFREGTPMVLLEAMSVGLPIISTDVGGVNELLEKYKDSVVITERKKSTWIKYIIDVLNSKNINVNNSINIDMIGNQSEFFKNF